LVSAAVGLALGAIALVTMLGLRRTLARVSRSSEVEAPGGATWSVRVVYGLSWPLTTRLARMTPEARRRRRRSGRLDASVAGDEIWHPRGLLDAFDEAAGLLAPFVVAAAIGIVVLFVVEMIVVLAIGLVFLLYSQVRGRWQVEIVDPARHRSIRDSSSLADARQSAARVVAQIRAGGSPTS
jgi:thiosulfate reductase cytochrome b subunit